MRAPFIVFEGADGVGKSTQAARLATRLETMGAPTLLTREPGGAPGAERLRALLVAGEADAWSPVAEALMMYAARAEHLRATINPARESGKIVICDRFSDSTRAYQGAAGAVSSDFIDALDCEVVSADGPTLTIVLDLDEAAAAARVSGRGTGPGAGETRFESKGLEFQRAVRAAFRKIAADAPATHMLVDASASAYVIEEEIAARVDPLIAAWRESDG